MCLFSVDDSIFSYFHFSFSPFFLWLCWFCFGTPSTPFSAHHLFFLLWLHLIFWFVLNLTVWFSSFFHTFDTIHCMCLFFFFPLFPLPFSFPFSQTFSFSQHWNTGGSHPEELERPGAHPRLKTRPQPPLFHPFVSPEPQFTDCVALPEHSIPGDQIAL